MSLFEESSGENDLSVVIGEKVPENCFILFGLVLVGIEEINLHLGFHISFYLPFLVIVRRRNQTIR